MLLTGGMYLFVGIKLLFLEDVYSEECRQFNNHYGYHFCYLTFFFFKLVCLKCFVCVCEFPYALRTYKKAASLCRRHVKKSGNYKGFK